jgi:hypothetical protein
VRSAIGIGGKVIAVDVIADGVAFVARCQTPTVLSEAVLVGTGATYEEALVSLRTCILAFRKRPKIA